MLQLTMWRPKSLLKAWEPFIILEARCSTPLNFSDMLTWWEIIGWIGWLIRQAKWSHGYLWSSRCYAYYDSASLLLSC